jgi:XRE family transcriptional regulator, regulator of sulfur utilization
MAQRSQRGQNLSLIDLGNRVREERLRRGISLDELSGRARVSRSMISEIERGTKAATVLVLDGVATGLETSLARLVASEVKSRIHVLRCSAPSVVRDLSGWERRILSPVLPGVEFEFMRTTLNPGVDAGTFLPRAHGSREYVAIEKGVLDLTLDGVLNTLKVGDSIYYDGDCLHGFANSGRTACAYYLAMDVSGDPAGAQHRITKDADPGDHASVRRPHANGTTAPGRGGGGASRVLRKAPRRVPSSRNGGKVHDK